MNRKTMDNMATLLHIINSKLHKLARAPDSEYELRFYSSN